MKKAENITILKSALEETIWPTRCAICDKPGYLLCPSCARKLPFIDQLKTCKLCGEPFGSLQCCGCGGSASFDKCVSVLFLNNETGKLITTYKDAGERRIANIIAYFLTQAINPSWINDTALLSYIPSTKEAYFQRGFDHARLIAEAVANKMDIKLINAFKRPASEDQRKLSRRQRQQNLSEKFQPTKDLLDSINAGYNEIILLDDVVTTGATLSSASSCLKKVGISSVKCINFSRTF